MRSFGRIDGVWPWEINDPGRQLVILKHMKDHSWGQMFTAVKYCCLRRQENLGEGKYCLNVAITFWMTISQPKKGWASLGKERFLSLEVWARREVHSLITKVSSNFMKSVKLAFYNHFLWSYDVTSMLTGKQVWIKTYRSSTYSYYWI